MEFEKKNKFYFLFFHFQSRCFFFFFLYWLGIGGGGVISTLKVSIGGGFALMLRDSNVHDVDVVQKDVAM